LKDFKDAKFSQEIRYIGSAKKIFFKKYNHRRRLSKKENYQMFKRKYRTVLNWLSVSYKEKELFWQNLKRDYENDKLDCYESRLEEIVNTCKSITREYCKHLIIQEIDLIF
jgi:hypothetical protein